MRRASGSPRGTVAAASALAAAAIAPLVLVATGQAPAAAGLISLTAVLAALFWALRSHVAGLLLVFLAVAGATTVLTGPRLNLGGSGAAGDGADVVGRWTAAGGFDEDLPIMVHIVLDEMMSTGAITDDFEGGTATREQLYAFGDDHRFRTFDSVYSRRYYSGVSLPHMMNAEFDGQTANADLPAAIQGVVADNSYFRAMAVRGYRTAVFQSAVINFCESPEVALCETFQSFDPAEDPTPSMGAGKQALALSETALRTFEPGYLPHYGLELLNAAWGMGRRESIVEGTAGRFDPHGFVRWFDRFGTFVEGVPRGTHVFAHFVVPHAPYLLSDTCEVGGRIGAGYSLVRQFPDESRRPAARLGYYADYLRQVSCVATKLDGLMRRLSSVESFADATFVIHGDHGSRISNGFVAADLKPQDLVDNFATYFAVRAPGMEPGIDCHFTSLPQAFSSIMGGAAAGGDPLPVLVRTAATGDPAAIEMPMPVFGCAAEP